MNFFAWVILGLWIGVSAKAIYPGCRGGGLLGTLALGMIGAFIGGSLFTFLQTGSS